MVVVVSPSSITPLEWRLNVSAGCGGWLQPGEEGRYNYFIWRYHNTIDDTTVNVMWIIGYDGSESDVVIPGTIRGVPVKVIGFDAFRDNNLTSVTIPPSVTDIGGSAFRNNKLTTVTIPDSVTLIRDFAFKNNELENVVIRNSVTNIGFEAFRHNYLESITIPDNVNSITAGAFVDNPLLNVTIGESVTFNRLGG